MMNFTEGASWSEAGAGTNAIGTALAAEHAVQVFAAEHFTEVVQAWTCSAAPVRDPDSGKLLGIIDLTSRMATAHPHSFICAVATAKAGESHLVCAMHERDARLRSRYADRVSAGGYRALVTPSGRILSDRPDGWLGAERLVPPPGGGELVLRSGRRAFVEPVGCEEGYIVRALDRSNASEARTLLRLRLLGQHRAVIEYNGRAVHLSRRHTEILALLASHLDGMTSDALAADLYGDSGRPAAVRVEISRLRSAAESYEGLLLPQSEAPGVVRDREALDRWLRQAVMTTDDCESLWAWIQCPSGRDDLPAWKRLLAQMHFRDPRRSLAAMQVRALRESYAM